MGCSIKPPCKDGITCEFTYACQGGTSEQWLFSMTKSEDGSDISCSVERPDGKSYLFFQSFSMHITGGYIKEAQVFGENKRPLPSSEYIITEGNSLVKEVDGEFQSHLDKVEVYVIPGRQEL